jgi:hypothetical protein
MQPPKRLLFENPAPTLKEAGTPLNPALMRDFQDVPVSLKVENAAQSSRFEFSVKNYSRKY